MTNPFFDHPILNSPYERPSRHWELDESGQPTQQIVASRRRAEFITPIPKPRKQKKSPRQRDFVFDEGEGLSDKGQQYDPTSIINEVRSPVDSWRSLPNPAQWRQLKRITREWLDNHLECRGGTYPALLMYQELADMACNRITAGNPASFSASAQTRR